MIASFTASARPSADPVSSFFPVFGFNCINSLSPLLGSTWHFLSANHRISSRNGTMALPKRIIKETERLMAEP